MIEASLPVDNFVFVQILETEDDTGGVEDGTGLGEHIGVDVHHQITTGCVLHHETHVGLGKAAKMFKVRT